MLTNSCVTGCFQRSLLQPSNSQRPAAFAHKTLWTGSGMSRSRILTGLEYSSSVPCKIQCSLSFGGHGSFPGAMVSLLRIWPFRPMVVSSPPPWFRSISRAALIAACCVSCTLDAFGVLLSLLTQRPSRLNTLRLFLLAISCLPCHRNPVTVSIPTKPSCGRRHRQEAHYAAPSIYAGRRGLFAIKRQKKLLGRHIGVE